MDFPAEIEYANQKQKMLLHTCCAPCSTYVLELLRAAFDLSLYFYDPNIHPEEEYKKRRDEMKGYAEAHCIRFIEGPYDTRAWFEAVKGLEGSKEGSERCFICYDLRMRVSARYARDNGFDWFATVLSVSPHKNAKKINEIGASLSEEYGIKYLTADFKKRDGFKKGIALSKEYGLYRQDYCGCIYSRHRTET